VYIDTIKNILSKVHNSKLLIKVNTMGDEYRIKKEYLKLLEIPEERLIIKIFNPIQSKYYELFNEIDILLDTFPYSGTTTTCDSMYMGTPVITLYNKDCHSHNVSS